MATETLHAVIIRKNGKTMFTFTVPPKLEKMYNDNADGKKKSTAWAGLTFYTMADMITDETYKNLLRTYGLFDDYGQPLLKDGLLNIAWVRTVGGTGSIKIDNNMPYSKLNTMLNCALKCIRCYFDDYLRAFKIKGTLEIEF